MWQYPQQKDKIAVSLRGKINNIGKKNLDIMFEKIHI